LTLKLSELEDFVEKFRISGREKLSKGELKKGIMKYWDVASDYSIKSRIQRLRELGYIRPDPEAPNIFKLKKTKNDEIDEIFGED